MNQWTNWQKRLAGEAVPIHEGEPDSGYYRIRRKDKATGKIHYSPAAFWRTPEGQLMGAVDGRMIDANGCIDHWLWAVKNPITEAEFRKVEAGGPWSDLDPEVHAQNGRGIGDNSGEVDEVELIREQIESAEVGAAIYAEINDDATLVKAQTLRSRLIELSNEADKKREAEKRPHFDAAKAVDAKWQPLIKAAKAVADTIRAAMSAWETKKLRAQQDAQRKIDEANKAAADAASMGGEPFIAPIAPLAPAKIKGASGKAAHVGTIKVVTAITDQAALYAYFAATDDVKIVLLGLAQRAVKAGQAVPGVTIEERADVR